MEKPICCEGGKCCEDEECCKNSTLSFEEIAEEISFQNNYFSLKKIMKEDQTRAKIDQNIVKIKDNHRYVDQFIVDENKN